MKLDKSWYPFLILIAIVVVGLVIQEIRKNKLLELKQRYSIATIIDIEHLRKQSPIVTFSYEIDSKSHIVKVKLNSSVEVGEKYVVTLPKGHEDEGYLLLDHPVPDGIEAQPNGWDEIPSF